MKVRVLGCSGAIARDCRTTSFLIDEDILVDAGTGVGDLTLAEMASIGDVFLTHSHLDHIAALPMMLDAVGALRTQPVRVHALPGTIAALKAHVFNDVIWPDFTALPDSTHPFLRFLPIEVGQVIEVAGRRVEALPAVHTVPAVGYAVSAGAAAWVFSGDTGRNACFWQRVNQLEVGALVIETAFSNRERDLADRSLHLSPQALAGELDCIGGAQPYPIYITHTKPAETELIMDEILRFDAQAPSAGGATHDIRWLRAGEVLQL